MPPLPLVLPWSSLPDLEAVAALHGRSVASLVAELASFPRGVSGWALVGEHAIVAAGLLVDHPDVPNVALAQLVRDPALPPESVLPMLDWLEAHGRTGGASRCRVSLMKAPGVGDVLAERGYQITERFLRMELGATRRPPGPLAEGLRLTSLAEVGTPAFLVMSNAAFAHVPGALPMSEEDWSSIAAGEGYRDELLAIVVDADGPCGFVRCEHQGSVGEIEAVGVAERLRRRGLGCWLLREAAERLRRAGCERIQLYVAETNEAARELYLGEGYRVVEVRESWERASATQAQRAL
jgi:ribosomal protein S18 acetylase RimI-like enzyme